MHSDWLNFLQQYTLLAQLPSEPNALIAPLNHLAVLSVSGDDAAHFLQGQTTCDIQKLVEKQPQLGAFCNAKGRTISTFIIIKQADEFQLILTAELLPIVQKKLQMYILRAKVNLTDQSDALVVIGLKNSSVQNQCYSYPEMENGQLFIGSPTQACEFWQAQTDVQTLSAHAWLALDIQAGIPWLFSTTSEEFVPQMLNLDHLNAISFEKGCYTGQEIVARTHYLGKNKRVLSQAHYQSAEPAEIGCAIIKANQEDTILGTVILHSPTKLLVVLKEAAFTAESLCLAMPHQPNITLAL